MPFLLLYPFSCTLVKGCGSWKASQKGLKTVKKCLTKKKQNFLQLQKVISCMSFYSFHTKRHLTELLGKKAKIPYRNKKTFEKKLEKTISAAQKKKCFQKRLPLILLGSIFH